MHKFRRTSCGCFNTQTNSRCRHGLPVFGVGRASFYRWRTAYRQYGVAGLETARQLRESCQSTSGCLISAPSLHVVTLDPLQFEVGERAICQRTLMSGTQDHSRRLVCFECFLPAGCT